MYIKQGASFFARFHLSWGFTPLSRWCCFRWLFEVTAGCVWDRTRRIRHREEKNSTLGEPETSERLHRVLAAHSKEESVSMNQYCVCLFSGNDTISAIWVILYRMSTFWSTEHKTDSALFCTFISFVSLDEDSSVSNQRTHPGMNRLFQTGTAYWFWEELKKSLRTVSVFSCFC